MEVHGLLPSGSLTVEKYLNDTLRPERLAEVDRISGTNLMPNYLVRVQFKADSNRRPAGPTKPATARGCRNI